MRFSVFENYTKIVTVDNYKKVKLFFMDTAGQEAFDRLRPMSYRKTDVFLACFAVDNPTSLQNMTEKWAPEVKQYCPNAKIFLVGLKKDLRQAQPHLVSVKNAQKVAKQISGGRYVECSAKTQEGIYDLFDFVLKCMLLKKKSDNSKECKLL